MKNSIVFLLLGLLVGGQAFVLWHDNASMVSRSSDAMRMIHVQPMFQGKKVVLDAQMRSQGGDPLKLNTLRFYLSNFVFLKNGAVVFEEKNSFHLLDLEDENTLDLKFDALEGRDFDGLRFKLGIDSLTHISGAMGGDLDPTKGMFWTWQSGYINFKLEGTFKKCPTRNHEFQFHLGGYLAPFQSVQSVQVKIPKGENLVLQLDLSPFFDQVDWVKKYSIMSPCKESVEASKVLANSFSVHAE
jgi:hypothetical protein